MCADAMLPRILYFPEVFEIATDTHQINEEILDSEIRLISEDGEQLGIMSAEAALKIAEEHEMDLVKIAPNSNPPVCRIMDYGKFRFEQTKKENCQGSHHYIITGNIFLYFPVADHYRLVRIIQEIVRQLGLFKTVPIFFGRKLCQSVSENELFPFSKEQCYHYCDKCGSVVGNKFHGRMGYCASEGKTRALYADVLPGWHDRICADVHHPHV